MYEKYKNLIDIHIHSAPDIIPRKLNDLELSRRMKGTPIVGAVLKSHYFCTCDRAALVNEVYPDRHLFGGLVLNQSCGGLNSTAVDMAAKTGAKIIWFPTCDAMHEKEIVENEEIEFSKKPAWAKIRLALQKEHDIPYLGILEEDGTISSSAIDVLKSIKANNLVLATGHISQKETMLLVKEASTMGIKKIVITHVTFPSTFFSIEEQLELVSYGAKLEHCYTTYATGKTSINTIAEQIKAVGPENVILSTDLGQPPRVYPDEGLIEFANDICDIGFTVDDVEVMMSENPQNLLGLVL